MSKLAQIGAVAAEELRYYNLGLRYWLATRRPGEKRKILVNGTPKTGTTWMVRMLASIPGYHAAGNFKGDIQKYLRAVPGNVIHGHERYKPELAAQLEQAQIAVVLMLRDPRDQVVSNLFHFRRDTTNRWYQEMNQLDLDEALLMLIEGRPGLPSVMQWCSTSKSWLDAGYPLIAVRYEDLLVQAEQELGRIAARLAIPLSPGLTRAIVQRNRFERLTMGKRIWSDGRRPGEENDASHFRKGIRGDWRSYFKPVHVERFKEVAGDLLIEWKYESSLAWE